MTERAIDPRSVTERSRGGPHRLDATSDPLTVAAWLARAAERWPDAPAIAGVDGSTLTYDELHELVLDQGARFRAFGVGRADVVVLALPDGPMAIAALLAVASVATVLPVAAQEQPEEYARILDEVPVRAILMDERPNAPLTRLAAEHSLPLLVASPRRDRPIGFVTSALRPGPPREPDPPSLDDDALYTLTSGTTSIPKIVAITHRSLWHQLESSRIWFGLAEGVRSLCLMPIAHLHSLIRCSLPVLATGGSVVWTPGFDSGRVVEWLERFEPTFISAAPAVHRMLVRACETAGWRSRPGVQRVFAASSDRLDVGTRRDLERLFDARVVQLYGLSETSPLIAATPSDGSTMPDGSTGRINASWDAVCVGSDGEPVGPGEVGEIAVSGGFINRIVGRQRGGVQRFDRHGRFLTGDLGRIDDDGFLFVDGRVDDVINRGGQKIHPATVEAAIATHRAVRAVAAFATPDPILGSRVAALVVLRDGLSVSVDELLDHAGQSLRSYMVPERLVITEAIPTNDLGKVSRHDLAELLDEPSVLPERAAVPSTEVVETILSTYRRVLRRDDIDPDASFFDLGGDSLASLYVLLELEERLGLNVPPATYMRVSSANALAAFVAARPGPVAEDRLVEVQPGKHSPHIIAVHGLDGMYSHLGVSLARLGLVPDLPISTLGSAGAEVLDREPSTLAELARAYAALIHERVRAPTALVGYSLGAHIALATANGLAAAGAEPELLVLIDDDAELDRRSFGAAIEPVPGLATERFYRHLVAGHPVAPFPGRVLFIRNEEDDADFRSDPTAGWGEVALGGIEVAVLAGNHHTLVEQDRLPALARVLLDALERGRSQPPTPLPGLDALRRSRYEARVACAQGDRGTEIDRYRAIIASDREQPAWVYENLATALIDSGSVDEGFRFLDEALRRDRWPLSVALRSAKRWLANARRADFVRQLAAASRLPTDHPSVLCQRGELTMAAYQPDEAEALFRRGLAMAPEHFRLHRGLAEVLYRRKRFLESAEVLAEANEQTPGLGWLIVQEAEMLLLAGLPERALEVLDRNPVLIDDAHRGPLVRSRVREALGGPVAN